MINVIFSHLAAFALGGVVTAQLLQLNRRPHPPRLSLNEDESIYIFCLRKALLHIMEASRCVSCVPPRSEDHLPTFVASLEQMLRRRIDAYQRQLQQLSDPALGQAWPSTTTTQERNAHD